MIGMDTVTMSREPCASPIPTTLAPAPAAAWRYGRPTRVMRWAVQSLVVFGAFSILVLPTRCCYLDAARSGHDPVPVYHQLDRVRTTAVCSPA